MNHKLRPEDVGMNSAQVIRMRSYYGQKEIEESDRYKQMLRESGDVGRMFVSSLPPSALIESVEPPNPRGRYNHVRVKVLKGRTKNTLLDGREYIAWFQARQRDNFSIKYVQPKDDSLGAIIKHNLTPGDFIVVRTSYSGKEIQESVGTMIEAFDKLLELVKTAR